jgi:dihydroorotate dehydrogenase (fumarate)
MDLSTNYMGITLKSPLVPSASPLSEELGNIKRLEDAGAAAIVLFSLFEEQLVMERLHLHHHMTHGTESYPEALSYFPEPEELHIGPDAYLNHIRRAKESVGIPVIASLNGASIGGWTDYARKMEQAGADAIELNIYYIPTDMDMNGAEVEQKYIDILKAVMSVVTVPVAVKLSPFFSNMAHMAMRLDSEGASALVLFNRFYQPDIDLDELEVQPRVLLSTPPELRLPLRWIAILFGKVRASLAATSGIHDGKDVIKMLMAGADVTMVCSVLLQYGIERLGMIEREIRVWMEQNEYESVRQMKGSISQRHCADPSAFERAQYMKALKGYKLS